MAVAFDNSVGVTGNAVGSLTTASFTISGSDRAFGITASCGQSGITLSTTTCGTVGGTSAGARAINGSRWAHAHYGVAPSTGSQTAACTFSDTFGTDLVLTVGTFTGVDQSTPISNYNTATGSSTIPSLTMSGSGADNMVYDAVGNTIGANDTVGANQTAIYNVANEQQRSSYQDGADGGVMSWTMEFSTVWAQVGFIIEEAVGGITRAPGAGSLALSGKVPGLSTGFKIPVPTGPLW